MKLYKTLNEENFPIVGKSNFLKAQNPIEYGYIVKDNITLPFYINKKLFFKYIVFPAGLIESQNTLYEAESFLEECVVFIKKTFPVDFILTEHTTSIFQCHPKNAYYCNFGSYILDLSQPEEVLFKNLHGKNRNAIRKAQKDNLEISFDENVFFECISLIIDTFKRQNLKCPNLEYFLNLKKHLQDEVIFCVVRYKGVIQGSAIISFSVNNNAYYMFGGSIINNHSGALNFLHWEIIKILKNKNVVNYDFVGARINPEEGSKYEGIQRFKERFGGQLNTGFLFKMPINKLKYKLYYLLLFLNNIIKFKVYHGDIIDQEYKRINNNG